MDQSVQPDNPVMLCVAPDPRYPDVWDRARDHLLDALVKGNGDKDWSVQDIYQQLCEGRLTLWAGVKEGKPFGHAVTKLTSYPQRSVMEVLAMGADGGHEEDWLHCLEQLKNVAKRWKLSAIVGTGRPGWARKLGAEERRVFEVDLKET